MAGAGQSRRNARPGGYSPAVEWTPALAFGADCEHWIRADLNTPNGSDIAALLDQIGSNDIPQATASLQPAYVADGGAVINNQPVARLNGTSEWLGNFTISGLGSKHRYIANVFVWKADNGGTNFFWDGDGSYVCRSASPVGSNIDFTVASGGNPANGAAALDTLYVVEAWTDGTNQYLRINGTEYSAANTNTPAALGYITLGWSSAGHSWTQIDWAEQVIAAYNASEFATQRANLYSYINAKYGTSLT